MHTDDETVEALRQVYATGVIPEEQVRLCVLADEARWIWKQAHALFPAAVEILDDDHGCEYLHKVAARL